MTLERSQQNDLPQMELPSMSSRAASRAKILAQRAIRRASKTAHEAASGLKSLDLLATYDRNSSSWRTLQACLLAQASGQAGGLAEFSETWPSAGLMRNGRTYRRQPWALPMKGNGFGSLLTPIKTDASLALSLRDGYSRSKAHSFGSLSEQMMGFPDGHTDLQPLATQSSPKSLN